MLEAAGDRFIYTGDAGVYDRMRSRKPGANRSICASIRSGGRSRAAALDGSADAWDR